MTTQEVAVAPGVFDQARAEAAVRELLLAGAASVAAEPVSEAYFDGLRQKVRSAGKARGKS